ALFAPIAIDRYRFTEPHGIDVEQVIPPAEASGSVDGNLPGDLVLVPVKDDKRAPDILFTTLSRHSRPVPVLGARVGGKSLVAVSPHGAYEVHMRSIERNGQLCHRASSKVLR